MDQTDFHLFEDVSWPTVRTWFKTIYSKLISLKECLGNGLSHINHPENYSHHNCACIEYVEQLRKIQKEVDRAISLSRGTYFDADSIKLLKEHK